MNKTELLLLCLLIIPLVVWDGLWKLIAMWKSARHHQLAWYICLAVFNTVGILPIVYLLWFQRDHPPAIAPRS